MVKVNDKRNRLRELRRQRGLSGEALAYLANCSPRAVYLYEKHGIEPRDPRVKQRIAHALGVAVSDIFTEEEVCPANAPTNAR